MKHGQTSQDVLNTGFSQCFICVNPWLNYGFRINRIIKAQPVASKQKVLSVSSLLSGAMVWGLMWYPYRILQGAGVSGELATLLTYAIALIFGLLATGPVWRELRTAGWWGIALMLSSGWTNFGYVLAILDGEVMRVLLLFYLAPLWTVLFALDAW